jgi:molybdopterin converting factor small subunit
MDIEIRLFASFRVFLPPGHTGFSFFITIDEEITVAELIALLNIPADTPKITVVRGNQVPEDYRIREGDTVSIFPPIAGG